MNSHMMPGETLKKERSTKIPGPENSHRRIITGIVDIRFVFSHAPFFCARFRLCTRSINGGQCGWPTSRINHRNPGLEENRATQNTRKGKSIFEMKNTVQDMIRVAQPRYSTMVENSLLGDVGVPALSGISLPIPCMTPSFDQALEVERPLYPFPICATQRAM